MTTGDVLPINSGYYDVNSCWIPYSVPYWNPPVYIQPSYVTIPYYVPTFPAVIDDGLKEEVKGLKEEIRKLRKELAKK